MSSERSKEQTEESNRLDRIDALYQELAEARDAVRDIERELRELGEDPLS